MDKMTDAKIRSWLEKNKPDTLADYRRYQAELTSDIASPQGAAHAPESLRTWLENRYPDILARIPLW